MDSRRPQFVLKLLPSMADFAFLLPIIFLLARMNGVKTLLGDGDTGWHIRTGDWILANHQVPATDLFSYTKPGQPWFAWEWLSETLFAWLHARGGLALVLLVTILLLGAMFVLLFRLARRKSSPPVAFLVLPLAIATSSVHWLARPHLFSWLFLVFFYSVLDEVREGKNRFLGFPRLALLPIATILWANLHAGFFLGIVLTGCFAAGEVLKLVLSPDGSRLEAERARAKAYFATSLACLAASLVNPYFYHLHTHVFQYVGDPYQSQHIMEFLTLSFHHPVALFFESLLALGLAAALWRAAQGSYTEAVLILVWGHAALLAARNLPLFAIVATPIVAAALDRFFSRLPNLDVAPWLHRFSIRFLATLRETGKIDSVPRWRVVSLAAAAILAALLFAPAPPRIFRAEYDPSTYPAAAIPMLEKEGPGRIFTTAEWGGYLIYRLYPDVRVFIDGRSDFYGGDFGRKYIDVMKAQYTWRKTLNEAGVDTILLPPDTELCAALKEAGDWRLTYDDGVALVFRAVRNDRDNAVRERSSGVSAGTSQGG
jgi:hypothetical protein